MSNVIKLDRNIRNQLADLSRQRQQLGRKFASVRDQLYLIKRELAQIDHDMTYLKKKLERIHEHS